MLLNSAQEFIQIQAWLLQAHVIKEYRCLKNVIHQLERNEWLLLSAFQQGLRQKLVLSEHRKTVFVEVSF